MRAWNEFVAVLADIFGGIPMLAFLSFLAAAITALLWAFWPRWLPRYWVGRLRRSRSERARAQRFRFRVGALRWRWRLRWRRKQRREEPTVELAPDELPDLPAGALVLSADQLAEQGRYAEAVRERLRAIVRDLVEREVIPFRPGWTVTELAAAASRARPVLGEPLSAASDVFSEIWYGLRPASATDDRAMRAHADSVTRLLATQPETAGAR